jgi:hypothetical protein
MEVSHQIQMRLSEVSADLSKLRREVNRYRSPSFQPTPNSFLPFRLHQIAFRCVLLD